jgi:hypothetical protein
MGWDRFLVGISLNPLFISNLNDSGRAQERIEGDLWSFKQNPYRVI